MARGRPTPAGVSAWRRGRSSCASAPRPAAACAPDEVAAPRGGGTTTGPQPARRRPSTGTATCAASSPGHLGHLDERWVAGSGAAAGAGARDRGRPAPPLLSVGRPPDARQPAGPSGRDEGSATARTGRSPGSPQSRPRAGDRGARLRSRRRLAAGGRGGQPPHAPGRRDRRPRPHAPRGRHDHPRPRPPVDPHRGPVAPTVDARAYGGAAHGRQWPVNRPEHAACAELLVGTTSCLNRLVRNPVRPRVTTSGTTCTSRSSSRTTDGRRRWGPGARVPAGGRSGLTAREDPTPPPTTGQTE